MVGKPKAVKSKPVVASKAPAPLDPIPTPSPGLSTKTSLMIAGGLIAGAAGLYFLTRGK